MSNQSGFDYDLLVHRLHRGACAFQSLRAHRRQRGAAPEPATVTEVRASNPPPPPSPVPDQSGDPCVMGSREPQAFMAVGGRVVPIFGDVNEALGAPVAGESQPPPPRAAPPPEEARPAAALTPAVSAATLKLPAPTPPPRLGLVNGGHPRPSAPEPTPTTRKETVAAAPAADAVAALTTQEAAATLAGMFDTYAQQEAARLAKVHADHRTALATLLQEHREELRATSEAHAARTALLLREVLAEHRAELARPAQTHAEHIAQATQSGAADQDLRAALIEQAKLQREANEDVADHISALTTIVADLGQTVGMLAVAAAQEARQGRLPPRPTVAAPPPIEPGADAPTPTPCVEAAPLDASSGAVTTETAPVSPLSTASAANWGDPSTPHRAAHTPASTPPLGSVPAPTAVSTIPATPPTESSAAQRRLTHAEETAAQARVRQFADEDRDDDDDLETGIDDDDLPRRPPLPPITDIDPPKIRERDHG